MSIPRRQGDLEPIDVPTCRELLASVPFVRLGFVSEQGPEILPVNHVMLDGRLYFRTETGTKLAAAAAEAKVAVEADGAEVDQHIGWSVLAHGRSRIVTDETLLERLHSMDFAPWSSPDAKLFWVEVTLDDLGGRRIVRDR